MTIVDERLDLEIEESETTEENNLMCVCQGCTEEAEWLVIWTCGDAFPYCGAHTRSYEWEAPRGMVTCNKTGKPTQIIRKEPIA